MATDDDIRNLIDSTDDKQQRALLMVLLRISQSLVENTQLTESLQSEFERHRADVGTYMERGKTWLNRSLGAWSAIMLFGGAMYGFGAYVVNINLDKIDKTVANVDVHDKRLASAESNLVIAKMEIESLKATLARQGAEVEALRSGRVGATSR